MYCKMNICMCSYSRTEETEGMWHFEAYHFEIDKYPKYKNLITFRYKMGQS